MVNARQKKTPRIQQVVIGVVLLVVIGVILAIAAASSTIPRGRLGIVLKGNPTIFLSWESDRSRFAILLFPETIQIESNNGWYELQALWKLDVMDRHGGMMYKKSLETALASPVLWYATGIDTAAQVTNTDHATEVIQQRLSLPNIFRMILTGKTNIKPFEAWYVWNQIQHMGSDAMTMYDFSRGQVTSEVTLPDETTVERFDSAKYDAIIGNTLEDTPFRQEGMRIALYNTTGTPGVAQKIARLIEHMGGFVVFVGNDENVYDGICEVVGEKFMLTSRTAQFFRTFYGCTLHETEGDKGRADIIVRIGKDMEKQYLFQ